MLYDRVLMDKKIYFFLINQQIIDLKNMNILEKLQLVKEMITQLVITYPHLKENYKIIAIDLSKQQALSFDPRAIQQIDFTENLNRNVNTKMFFFFLFSLLI